jgi:phage-related tail fiber protein
MKARRLAHFEPYLDQQIQEIIKVVNINTPPGTIVLVPRATPWPGWIKANGALLSRTDYADLWAEAQDSGLLVSEATWAANNWGCYSTGNGSTTFRIPDLRAEFLRAVDDGRGVDSGRTVGSWQDNMIKPHAHRIGVVVGTSARPEWTIPDTSTSAGNYPGVGGSSPNSRAYGFTDNSVYNSTSLIASSETRPRNIALLACIKY